MSARRVALLVAGCRPQLDVCTAWDAPARGEGSGNLVLAIFDDVGPDRISGYDERSVVADPPAHTPTIDCLLDQGVHFSTAWGAPVCSPGRANLLTGLQPSRSGVVHNLNDTGEMDDEVVTLADAMRDGGYSTGYVGKWHLAGWDGPDGATDALSQGFDWFAGTPINIATSFGPPPPIADEEESYYGYWHVGPDGAREWTTRYLIERDVDDALAFVQQAEPPWLLVLAMHAAHEPLVPPPSHLVEGQYGANDPNPVLYRATLEAADHELARFLRALGPELSGTTVVLTADNGTSGEAFSERADDRHAKATLYEPGVRVPLVAVGPSVAARGAVIDTPIHQNDVMPTVLDWAGLPLPAVDGEVRPELLGGQEVGTDGVMVTSWQPLGGRWEAAARDERYKLIVRDVDGEYEAEMYDLATDPDERADLLDRVGLAPEPALAFGALLAAIGAEAPSPVR